MNMQFEPPAGASPTLADLIAAVEGHLDLEPTRRRDLLSAARTLARWLHRRPEEIPATANALRELLGAVHPVQARISAKRLRNVKAELAAGLRILEEAVTRAPCPVHLAAWDARLAILDNRYHRYDLARFRKYCARERILPEQVDDATVLAFRQDLEAHSVIKDPETVWRRTIRAWNRLAAGSGDALQSLSRPPSRQRPTVPLEDLPDSFRADLQAFLDRLAQTDPFADDGPAEPLRADTLIGFRNIVRQAASILVFLGHDRQSIGSLAYLVEVEHFKAVLRYYLDKYAGVAPSWLYRNASNLVTIAKYHVKVPPDQLQALQALRQKVKCPQRGMTERNKRRLRQFDDEANVERLLALPQALLAKAERQQHGSPRAASWVLAAVAIELLLVCPLRLKNLATLKLDHSFVWRGSGKDRRLVIFVPGDEVKNNQAIETPPLPGRTSRLTWTYWNRYRPWLGTPASDWLFPARNGSHRQRCDLATLIRSTIERETGLQMNVHLFRHFAAWMYLRRNPGHFETVRRLLGHKSLQTTTTFYAEFDSKWAIGHYHEHILKWWDE